ncbi:NAD-dependent epimerase/dehydratase family protein [Serratia odorifera]|uniref:NAD dependent epimerase/dehydratase family protein n=2 Tax=Serratia odorifera TaxID=618 RepID=D4E518_SEROD|nr:NAD-dependent epimerase/dehydratase family protein [Serratia odorifera]EFE95214.1 NAD dependent epimerase/dehydratase family protein [Serratia odorifera DSM 4582]MBJ2064437.1 NAD-dependent epimerase/dehydratase family protein [Serratia odorifera]PNK89847.1 UDP-N-acetylglucosamine 4-epimerase [Serratia odorifera]RII70570.1 NAD-dependent epimerase/dehydratase family protein [Serratia odorifera]VDZ61875.1 dTDP-glucose 4,6-dehydratase [Serratia odorifera]
MDKRKVAIIGGSGFIGTRLVKRLRSRSDLALTIIDKRPSEAFAELYQYGDVTEPQSLQSALAGCDAVINLAAEHQDNVEPIARYYQVNVEGARNLCKLASMLDIRQLVFTSSVAVYGFVKQETGEDGAFAPFNHYGKSKLEAEYVYEAWHKADQANRLTIIRPTVVFGEGNRGNVYNLFRQIASGRFVMIGSGNNMKSMAYVENIAARLEHALDQQLHYQVSNYVDKPDFTMNQLVDVISSSLGRNNMTVRIPYVVGVCAASVLDLLAKITRRKFPISRIRIQKFCARTQFKSNQQGDFIAPVDLNSAIEKTIRHEFTGR